MKIERFEEILAWQKAKELTKNIYKLLAPIKDYGFKDQIQRAAVSVMNNVAEGFERRSDKEFKHFLFVAKGSCGEVRSMLILAKELDYIEKNTCADLILETERISKMLSNFIKMLD
ncbi:MULTISPECIES: four helix bundle protein [Butyricimonas]|uniref:Four helix bundle protein n=1 Tax=Butyricimonas hominis TaxID=2763032 RepID=A0ABR7CW98_9BACT|nr:MULTISPECIES: four helix bundle protein [Butyricimonas]MBC5619948.1 four helix bundle protein [Butyricimonas hominis]MCB6973829.1 four helix bundle protein [Butyricimonas synergistica]MCG4520640.1 four helix bundle protein [Butyricimonas sp. DFI.6.44]